MTDLVERLRYELTLPVQSQFIRSDVAELLDFVDDLQTELAQAHSNIDQLLAELKCSQQQERKHA